MIKKTLIFKNEAHFKRFMDSKLRIQDAPATTLEVGVHAGPARREFTVAPSKIVNMVKPFLEKVYQKDPKAKVVFNVTPLDSDGDVADGASVVSVNSLAEAIKVLEDFRTGRRAGI